MLGLFLDKLTRAMFALDIRNQPLAVFFVFGGAVRSSVSCMGLGVCRLGYVVVEDGVFDVRVEASFLVVSVRMDSLDYNMLPRRMMEVKPGPNVSVQK